MSELTSFLAFVLIEKHNRTFINVESSGSPSTSVVTGLADRYKSVKVPATTNAPMMDSMVLQSTFSFSKMHNYLVVYIHFCMLSSSAFLKTPFKLTNKL